MSALSKQQAQQHYQWGDHCDGWILVDTAALSVKQERMPAYTEEVLHYHQHAQQFFFILQGVAEFEIEGNRFVVNAGEGCHIQAGSKHRVLNTTDSALEFILSSQPSTNNDRFNCS